MLVQRSDSVAQALHATRVELGYCLALFILNCVEAGLWSRSVGSGGSSLFLTCSASSFSSGGISAGEGVFLPRSRIQVVRGTVPRQCARNARPARLGILCRPAIE